MPLPAGAELDNDDSGIRPSKQPPISIGGTLAYQCPGVKSVMPTERNITKPKQTNKTIKNKTKQNKPTNETGTKIIILTAQLLHTLA